MTTQSSDPDPEVGNALRSVVEIYGTAVLSNPKMLSNLFKDLLPDSPRQAFLLVTAAEDDVAGSLEQRFSQGIGEISALRIVATALSEDRAIELPAALWVTAEFIRALGHTLADGPDGSVGPPIPSGEEATLGPPPGPDAYPGAPTSTGEEPTTLGPTDGSDVFGGPPTSIGPESILAPKALHTQHLASPGQVPPDAGRPDHPATEPEGPVRSRRRLAVLAGACALAIAVAIALLQVGSKGKSASRGAPASSSRAAVSTAPASSSRAEASTATSAASFGGVNALVAAAQKEGTLNVIALPPDWANYGTIMKNFTAKYGIKINDTDPDGSSQDELNAVTRLKGQSGAPDVLDVGTSVALTAASSGLLAPYKVQSWNNIPAVEKATNGDWFDDYGGYVAIGYDSSKVKDPPTSFADLLRPEYKNEVAITGNPTQDSSAFSAVYAAALANGGSLSDITPGVKYFKKLQSEGNFVPGGGGPSTVESGRTPILIWWDYLQASEVGAKDPNWKIVIPTDAHYAGYYTQAITASAPHPAAARLWEEYLYSVTGQNLWLQGHARPVELSDLVQNGTVDQAAYQALLPTPPGSVQLPTEAQLTAARNIVSQQWPQAIGG